MLGVELEQMTSREQIVQYIQLFQTRGVFLPYRDHEYIETWLTLANEDSNFLLLVLSELLPPYFSTSPRSLSGIHKRVVQRLANK